MERYVIQSLIINKQDRNIFYVWICNHKYTVFLLGIYVYPNAAVGQFSGTACKWYKYSSPALAVDADRHFLKTFLISIF